MPAVQITNVEPTTIDAVDQQITIEGAALGQINYIKLVPQGAGSAISVYDLDVDEGGTSGTFSAPAGLTAGKWNVVAQTSDGPVAADEAITFVAEPPAGQPTPQQQCQQAYQDLLSNPAEFLAANPVILRNQNVLTGKQTIYMSISTHHDNNNNQTTVYELSTGELDKGCSFTAYCIGATPFSDLSSPPPANNLPAYSLPAGADPMLLVTPVLSGCCMVTQSLDGNGPFIAHISPDSASGQEPVALQTALEGSVFQGSEIATSQYGAKDYLTWDTPKATFLGVRSDGNWTTYQQQQAKNYKVVGPIGSASLS